MKIIPTMKILLAVMCCWVFQVCNAQLKPEMVLNADPQYSNAMRNKALIGRFETIRTIKVSSRIYQPNEYRNRSTLLSINKAIALCCDELRNHPLVLRGINVVESNTSSVAVVRLERQYRIVGKLVWRVHRISKRALYRKAHHKLIQVFYFS